MRWRRYLPKSEEQVSSMLDPRAVVKNRSNNILVWLLREIVEKCNFSIYNYL